MALSAHFSVTLTSLVQLFNAPRVTAHRLACLLDTCSAVCFLMHGAKFGADLHALFERITTSICVFLLLVTLCSTLSGTPNECSVSPASRATSFLQFLRLEDHSIAYDTLWFHLLHFIPRLLIPIHQFVSFYSKTQPFPTSLHQTNQNQNQIQSIYNNTSLWDTPLDQ